MGKRKRSAGSTAAASAFVVGSLAARIGLIVFDFIFVSNYRFDTEMQQEIENDRITTG